MTLTEFLLPRIAEDEAAAQAALRFDVSARGRYVPPIQCYVRDEPTGDLDVSATRVLAECEAKRRIITQVQYMLYSSQGWEPELDAILRHLALPYADHPDYRDEWRP